MESGGKTAPSEWKNTACTHLKQKKLNTVNPLTPKDLKISLSEHFKK
jgi:hypothetical protein